jgi:diaminopropionate ammonia-lyase
MDQIKWIANLVPKSEDRYLPTLSAEKIEKARTFIKSFPQYTETPLASLKEMASTLGLGGIYIKDESYRFGLNSFKVLGGAFAIAEFIAQKLGKDVSDLPYEILTSDAIKSTMGQFTFFVATDGNHGRGIAWAANQLGQRAVVFMPKGSSPHRLDNILKEGAEATIQTVNYDECVRLAAVASESTPNSVVIQDTAWEGYEDIPIWIMQGYGIMAIEANEQLHRQGIDRPTHLFVQAGVGTFAASAQGAFANLYPDHCPITVVVEPNAANCYYQSAVACDGERRIVSGDMDSIMAGLACGEPNTIGWDILKNHSSYFISCPDQITAKGMRTLGAPFKGDPQVVSGESGAVTMGILAEIMTNDALKSLKSALKLDSQSRVLLFSTEGNTDPDMYRKIVHEGYLPSY